MRFPWFLVAVPLLAGAVEAQVPVAPTLALMVMDVPAGPSTLRPDSMHEIPFTVHMSATNFACSADAILPIEISDASSGRPAFLRAHGNPATVNATIPAGAYAGDARAFQAVLDARFMIMVGEDATAHSHTFKVRAATPGGLPAGCQAAGAFPAAESVADHSVRIAADPPPVGGSPSPGSRSANGTASSPEGASPPSTNPAPAAGIPAAAAVAIAAGLVLRRP